MSILKSISENFDSLSNQEKWDLIVSTIDELGEELQELAELSESFESTESALFSLRSSVDELGDCELED